MELRFIKMHGCGNDFLFMDYISTDPPTLYPREVQWLCDRNFGIGADGLVILHKSHEYHAQWTFFNADGSRAEMCGNAARCAVHFLAKHYFPHDSPIAIETQVGIIKGRRLETPGMIEITLTPNPVVSFAYEQRVIATDKYSMQVFLVNTGVPHAVVEVKDITTYPILQVGRDLRNHPAFAPAGTNVTFFQKLVGSRIRATTFERGVEGETLACGTGAAAAAIVYSEIYMQPFPVEVTLPGGDLTVDISPVSKMLLLQGPVQEVFEVTINDLKNTFEKSYLYSDRRKVKK